MPKRTRGKKNRRGLLLEPEEPSSLKLGTLEELMQARTSVLDPPWEGSNLIPGDVLWSDPSLTPGLSPKEQRCIGLLWGPNYTEEFLKKYQLKLIIRSHEGPDAREKRAGLAGMDLGYTIDHDVNLESLSLSSELQTIHSSRFLGYTIDHNVESGKLYTKEKWNQIYISCFIKVETRCNVLHTLWIESFKEV